MTLVQLLAWNRKIPLSEYEALLKKLESKQKALGRAQEAVYSEEVSLDVLKEEKGSERWQRHERAYQASLRRIEKLTKEISALKCKLAGEQLLEV